MPCTDKEPVTSLFVDMDVSDFAEFMFVRNVNNSIIELSLGGVENNKDLFCFLVDLLCKGLVLMFGQNNRLEIENLTLEDFLALKRKMGLAGIQVNLDITPNTENTPCSVNIYDIEQYPDDALLQDYKFIVTSPGSIYQIGFNLVKVIPH
jgi:hypothetical protein